MRILDAFPSPFVKADDLNGRVRRVTIKTLRMEKIRGRQTPVLYFEKATKGLVLNKTNATAIAKLYGDETDRWPGKELILFPTMVDFQGKPAPAIRVRSPALEVAKSA